MWGNKLISCHCPHHPLHPTCFPFSPSPHTYNVSVTLAAFCSGILQACSYPRARWRVRQDLHSLCTSYFHLSWMFSSVLPMTGSFSSFKPQFKSSRISILTTSFIAANLSNHLPSPSYHLPWFYFPSHIYCYLKIPPKYLLFCLLSESIHWNVSPLRTGPLSCFTTPSSRPNICLAQSRCPINIWWVNECFSGKRAIELWPYSFSPPAWTTSWSRHPA